MDKDLSFSVNCCKATALILNFSSGPLLEDVNLLPFVIQIKQAYPDWANLRNCYNAHLRE